VRNEDVFEHWKLVFVRNVSATTTSPATAISRGFARTYRVTERIKFKVENLCYLYFIRRISISSLTTLRYVHGQFRVFIYGRALLLIMYTVYRRYIVPIIHAEADPAWRVLKTNRIEPLEWWARQNTWTETDCKLYVYNIYSAGWILIGDYITIIIIVVFDVVRRNNDDFFFSKQNIH